MGKPKILVAGDEPLGVELLEGILSKDYDVETAHDGNEALLKVEKANPDLIILDKIMPVMNSFGVCKIIKRNEKTLHIPIVMVTALTEKTDKIKAIEAGADDFLSKPVDVDELNARVKSLLRIKYYRDSLVEEQKRLSEIITNLW